MSKQDQWAKAIKSIAKRDRDRELYRATHKSKHQKDRERRGVEKSWR
jgi:hypothetical protein